MMLRSLTVLLLACTAWAPPAEARPPAPGPACLDARRITEVQQPDPRTLAILATDGRRFRVQLTEECPAVARAGGTLLAKDGWMCGRAGEYLRASGRSCTVAALYLIDAAEYARLARASTRSASDVVTLDAVQVQGERRRGFSGSPSYCFDPRFVRAWSEDQQGILVETSPKRAGGNRYYRVELAGSCHDLSRSLGIGFESGVGIGLICGNPGDRILDLSAPQEDIARSSFTSRVRCDISAVYPVTGTE